MKHFTGVFVIYIRETLHTVGCTAWDSSTSGLQSLKKLAGEGHRQREDGGETADKDFPSPYGRGSYVEARRAGQGLLRWTKT